MGALVNFSVGGFLRMANRKAEIRFPVNPLRRQAGIQMSAIAAALDAFESDNGRYPKALDDLTVQPTDCPNWHQHMQAVPLDPWRHHYIYDVPGKHRSNSYDLSSMGMDGKVGGDDDIVNWQANK
jgi:general secretion pathway protein G